MSRQTIRALEFGLTAPHRVAAAMTLGRVRSEVRHGGRLSPLRLREIPRPERHPGWVRVAPTLAGICASDRKILDVTGMGTTLAALYGVSKRVVPGHEVVGVVVEADGHAQVAEGDRVVVEPLLGCADKGFSACARCARGDDAQCHRFTEAGTVARGPGFGLPNHANLGGGWADELVAPAARAFRVPDGIEDRAAVLAEPLSIGVHAVLRNLPEPGQRVLVIGPGAIGLCAVLALHHLVPDAAVTVAGLGHFADDLARQAGAASLLHGTRAELVEGAGGLLGSTVLGNRLSGPVLEDGFHLVLDAVGSPQTLDDALRMTRPGGQVVLIGTAARQPMDWSLVWHRELRIAGTVYYGTEDVPATARVAPGRRRAMQVALDVLADARPAQLVTHVFPLDQAVPALETAAAGPGANAVRVAFQP